MGRFLSLPILIIAAALQASFVPQIRLLGGGPDLVFLLVLAWAINADLEESVIWAFVGGICQDLLSAAPVGTSVVGMLLIVFAISGIGRQVYRTGFVVLVGMVLIGTLLQQILIMIILWFTGWHINWLVDLTYIVAPTIFYNLLLILPVYWFVRRTQRGIRPDPLS
ncbi:MAG: rod shape-determining protein MreD [Aggregatilineales bacterium]